MRIGSTFKSLLVSGIILVVMLSVSPGSAETPAPSLFDHFSLKVAGSWASLTTEIRLDSEVLGRGTTLKFEDDLNLASDKTIPTLAFDWQIAKKHKLGLRWQDIDRTASSQTLKEIEWGDEIIPINADIRLGYDIKQTFLDYAYYPWIRENWAAGFGIGIRIMEISTSLAWNLEGGGGEGETKAEGTGPLPYLYFEYRRLFSENWRLQTGLGWLDVTVGDISGSQYIGKASIEYLCGENGRGWRRGRANLS